MGVKRTLGLERTLGQFRVQGSMEMVWMKRRGRTSGFQVDLDKVCWSNADILRLSPGFNCEIE